MVFLCTPNKLIKVEHFISATPRSKRDPGSSCLSSFRSWPVKETTNDVEKPLIDCHLFFSKFSNSEV